MLPCVLFEDEHLLVVNKPANLNTHSPSPYAGEGIYDWLRHREPRWSNLAIIHRLDKQTSGVLIFALSAAANRSLTAQFAGREVRKKYLLSTDRLGTPIPERVRSTILKTGDKFVSRPWRAGAELAETEFEKVPAGAWGLINPGLLPKGTQWVLARPLTGRTHQIRVHAAAAGFPVFGDTLYGGTAASRLYLHAWQISLKHPVSGEAMSFTAEWRPVSLDAQLREAIIDPGETDSCRLIHGEADGYPGVYVDKLGPFLLVQTEGEVSPPARELADKLALRHQSAGVYHKLLTRLARGKGAEASPRLLCGAEAPERFLIRENGLRYELSFREGYSVGLFLDQRDNRRRLLNAHAGKEFALPKTAAAEDSKVEVLNTFAYTCGFSVAAARAGARTTSLDLSKKYLQWGRRNFELNDISLEGQDFIFGDVFDWLKRFARKDRRFDMVILDPPTFSQSREHGVFRAEKDYPSLLGAALPLLKSGGVLLASSNAADWRPEAFVQTQKAAVTRAGRRIVGMHYVPQPPDFPVSRVEAAYLKTVWICID